jgi:hypothetical protein
MTLVESYQIVSRSIVALSVKRLPNQPVPADIPTIIGTGFVVDEGLVATNDHVVKIADQLATLPGCPQDEWPIEAMLFHLLPEKGMIQLGMQVIGAWVVGTFKPGPAYYGPKYPDLGFVRIKMRGLPRLEVSADEESIQPGITIATAGFPMGTNALRAPGYIHQLTPSLQEGIVSAVLPFPCKTPHAFMLNLMSLGGASGSPIFLTNSPMVVGVLYGGLSETYRTTIQGLTWEYPVPTNFTYCVPGHYLKAALENIRSKPELVFPPDTPTLTEALNSVP